MATQTIDTAGREQHPRGLWVLAFTELWERFSYYGMMALLALYMTKQLLKPGHAEHVWGLAALRHFFEFRGPMSDIAFTSLVFGWYGGLVYFTPILGGLVADRWLGTRRTVTLGAVLMAAGHLAMSLDQTFLIALLMLILGSGCLKGNITTQVGALYPAEAESLRQRGYAIFSTGINVGAVIGPLVTAAVAAAYGWHAGFAVAAVLMLLALAVYLGGGRHLPDGRPARAAAAELPLAAAGDSRRLVALVVIVALVIPASVGFLMISGIGMIWIDGYVDLTTPAGTVPVGWFNSLDSFSSILIAPCLIVLWAWQARRQNEPSGITKIAIGSLLVALSSLAFAAGSALSPQPGTVPAVWALAGYLGMGVAFMWYWPVLLALVSSNAPARVNSTMMGATFLSLFIGSVGGGWLGSFYDQMSPAAFWTINAAVPAAGGLLALILRGPLQRALQPAT
ncbi:MAG: peptide MFS transporter [Novosphingobium sp.]|jgi:POT family proton-dependent oligopeptide transporter|uniref:peptide MFS transporter n=1 Tax=Novosphingobium sp. TaxID=1874826 RepID=UPI0039198883